eukprot:211066_1
MEHLKLCIRRIILYWCICLYYLCYAVLKHSITKGTITRTGIIYILFPMIFEYRLIWAPTQELVINQILFYLLETIFEYSIIKGTNPITGICIILLWYLLYTYYKLKTKGTNPRTGICIVLLWYFWHTYYKLILFLIFWFDGIYILAISKLSKEKSLSEAAIARTLHFGQLNESITLLTQQFSQITINPSLPSQPQPPPPSPHPFQPQIPPRHTLHGHSIVLNLTLLFHHFRFYLMVIWCILFPGKISYYQFYFQLNHLVFFFFFWSNISDYTISNI